MITKLKIADAEIVVEFNPVAAHFFHELTEMNLYDPLPILEKIKVVTEAEKLKIIAALVYSGQCGAMEDFGDPMKSFMWIWKNIATMNPDDMTKLFSKAFGADDEGEKKKEAMSEEKKLDTVTP